MNGAVELLEFMIIPSLIGMFIGDTKTVVAKRIMTQEMAKRKTCGTKHGGDPNISQSDRVNMDLKKVILSLDLDDRLQLSVII